MLHFLCSLGASDKKYENKAIYRCQYKNADRKLGLLGCKARYMMKFNGKWDDATDMDLFNLDNWTFDSKWLDKQEHTYPDELRPDAQRANNGGRHCLGVIISFNFSLKQKVLTFE